MYEQFPCLDATAQGLDGLSFSVRGPAAASVSIELQSRAECGDGDGDDDDYSSAYYTVDGLSGDLETVSVPLSSWTGDDVHLTGIVGVVWFGFSPGSNATDNEWALDTVQLSCAAATPPEDPEPTSTSSSTTVTATATETASTSTEAATTTTTAEATATQEAV